MREYTAPALILLFLPIFGQTVPTGWKVVKDSKGTCQVAVPADWVPLGENSGAAVFHDATTAVAAVTSQPGQTFKPLTDALMKLRSVKKGYSRIQPSAPSIRTRPPGIPRIKMGTPLACREKAAHAVVGWLSSQAYPRRPRRRSLLVSAQWSNNAVGQARLERSSRRNRIRHHAHPK